jgi:hypothetical protein
MGKSGETKYRQLLRLIDFQQGKCAVCGRPASIDDQTNPPVRFRIGSSYGAPGRVRPRVMAHHKCALERSSEITASQPLDELRRRSGRLGDVFDAQ